MSCTIKANKPFTVNGSTSLYGGAIVSISLNFSLISSQTRGDITVVQDGDTPMTTPEAGDSISLELLGGKFKFQVAGYQFSNNAGSSATTLNVKFADNSNKHLDQQFVFLKEMVPDFINSNSHVLGKKYGPQPNTDLEGLVIPNSDTAFIDIRSYWEAIQAQTLLSPFLADLSDADVDYNVLNSQGKTMWYTNGDVARVGDTFKNALGDLLSGTLPDGRYSFSGSFRQVLNSIAGQTGRIVYWDPTVDKVKMPARIDTSAGLAALNKLAATCNVVSSSNSADFTVTAMKGAIGTFSSETNRSFSSTSGGAYKRYYRVSALNPDFHFTPCRFNGQPDKLQKLEFDNQSIAGQGVLHAMAAAHYPKIYAMYALQSMLQANFNKAKAVEVKFLREKLKNKGRGNNTNEQQAFWPDETELATGNFWINPLFQHYYRAGAANVRYPCTAEVWPFAIKDIAAQKPISRAFHEKGLGWNDADEENQAPKSFAGQFETEAGVGKFDNGLMFLQYAVEDGGDRTLGFRTILGEQGFTAETDLLRQYLVQLSLFRNRFWAIKEGNGLNTIRDVAGKSFGYYIDSSSSSPKFEVEAGFSVVTIDPYCTVLTTPMSLLKDLFTALCGMYNPGAAICPITLNKNFGDVTVIEFINALERNNLKSFFSNPPNWIAKHGVAQNNKKTFTAKEKEDKPNYQMFLIQRDEQEGPPWNKTTIQEGGICFAKRGVVTEQSSMLKAEEIAQKIYQLNITGTQSVGDGPQAREQDPEFLLNESRLWVIGEENIGSHIPLWSFPQMPAQMRAWFTLDTSASQTWSKQGNFFVSRTAVPDKNDKIWTSSVQLGVDVSAADLGINGAAFNEYKATSAAGGANPYSIATQQRMIKELERKIDAASWFDDTHAISQQLKLILENGSTLDIPSFENGLESLSLSLRDGRVEVSLSVGNTFERQAKRALLELGVANVDQSLPYMTNIPDTFKGGASPRVVSSSAGLQI